MYLTKKWQVELNNAQAELNKLNKQLDDNETALQDVDKATDETEKELKDLKSGLDDAGKGASIFGDVLKANLTSEAIISGVKALGSAVASIGKGFIDVGKQALDSYADFEQLEGGVKKLFGDDMQSVMDNANNAYKTAGMNANEYMETVTGFSASLISSLGGDTKKASEYADMAITDMADNANTFGTDIASLQQTYAGFAKGQFGMLDNLKLGYGGTKTEMERLLKDAEKMPEAMGKKFDISNYSDVVQAINVVQKNMGIAGTTANEASATISGSLSSMSSAWSNLLTGLASGQDISGLIDNLVQSVLDAVDNILPTIYTIGETIVAELPNVLNKIVEKLPEFLEMGVQIIEMLVAGLTENGGQIIGAVIQIVSMLTTTILENLPMILQMGITMLVELVKGIAQSLPTLIPAVIDALILMVETLIDNIDLIIDAGIQLIMGLADGLMNAMPTLIEKMPILIDKLIVAITDNLPKIIEMGIKLTIELAKGLIKALPDLLKAIPQIITSLVNGFKNYRSKLIDIGKDMLKGMWEGIKDMGDWLWKKVKDLLGGLTDKIKNFFGIKSPSRLFKNEIGTNLALGLGEGFEDTMEDVTKDMTNAIPTEFDTDINANYGSSASLGGSNYDNLVSAFKTALKDVKVVMNDREFGTFIENTMEKVVYN